MEGKVVKMSALLLLVVVVLGQIHHQVEAEFCCPGTVAYYGYKACLLPGAIPQFTCAAVWGCHRFDSSCPSDWTPVNDILENAAEVNEFCKVGCVSSVCATITTLQHSADAADAASEVVANGAAVEKCANACSALCTKKLASATNAVGTA